ncbi:MAG: signal peptidase II [Bacteroidetes bacterium]|nr:signal peptidase II [Bacteroidota bacterium]
MFIIAILITADQVSKYLSSSYLDGSEKVLFDGILGLTYKENSGLVFSLGSNIESIFYISLFVKIIALFIWLMLYKYYITYYRSNTTIRIANAFFVSCWAGNLIDLIVFGYIRDMIIWPGPGIPNLADIYFYIGLFLLFNELVKNPQIDIKKDIIMCNHKNTLRFLQSFSIFIVSNVKKMFTINR